MLSIDMTGRTVLWKAISDEVAKLPGIKTAQHISQILTDHYRKKGIIT